MPVKQISVVVRRYCAAIIFLSVRTSLEQTQRFDVIIASARQMGMTQQIVEQGAVTQPCSNLLSVV